MKLTTYLSLYHRFSDDYRNYTYDKLFTKETRRIINNIMKYDKVDRETAAIKLIKMLKYCDEEGVKYYYV